MATAIAPTTNFAPTWLLVSIMDSVMFAPSSLRWLSAEQPFAAAALREFALKHGLTVEQVEPTPHAGRMLLVETPSHHTYEVVMP